MSLMVTLPPDIASGEFPQVVSDQASKDLRTCELETATYAFDRLSGKLSNLQDGGGFLCELQSSFICVAHPSQTHSCFSEVKFHTQDLALNNQSPASYGVKVSHQAAGRDQARTSLRHGPNNFLSPSPPFNHRNKPAVSNTIGVRRCARWPKRPAGRPSPRQRIRRVRLCVDISVVVAPQGHIHISTKPS